MLVTKTCNRLQQSALGTYALISVSKFIEITGGGLGGTRRGGPDVNIKHSGREDDRRRGGSSRDEDRVVSVKLHCCFN